MATRSWNRVELIGNLTRDPELRFTPTGTAVCTFSIATNRTYVSDGERKEEADFHRVVSWNKLAELCNQLLKKGNRVFVSGRLQNRSWDGQDGQQRQVTEIVIEDMILLTSKSGTSENMEDVSTEEKTSKPAPAQAVSEPKEEVPAEVEEPATTKNEPESEAKGDENAPAEDSEESKEKPKNEDPGNLDDLPF